MYADRITNSMQLTIDETNRRREKQIKYNTEHHIIPQTVFKSREDIMQQTSVLNVRTTSPDAYIEMEDELSMVAEPVIQYMTAEQLHKTIETTRQKMLEASRDTDYLTAAKLRDEMLSTQKLLKEKFGEK
jgi:excinuclease ABC subunit B